MLYSFIFKSFFLMAVFIFAGLNTDGIYRVSGNLTEIQKLRYAADRGM